MVIVFWLIDCFKSFTVLSPAQEFFTYPKDRGGPLTTHKGMWRIYSNPDSHGSPISRLLRHTRGCGGTILTLILRGSNDGDNDDDDDEDDYGDEDDNDHL
jgi:hypothetical protein